MLSKFDVIPVFIKKQDKGTSRALFDLFENIFYKQREFNKFEKDYYKMWQKVITMRAGITKCDKKL